MSGRGKAQKNIDLIGAAVRIFEEIQPDWLDLDAWTHAIKVEAAERESMKKFMAGYQRSISGPVDKYGETP